MINLRLRLMLGLILFFGVILDSERAAAAQALPIVAEIEPNNEPLQGLTFTSPAVLSGLLSEINDQDAFRWRISDADAQQFWTLTLTGIPEALTGTSLIRVATDKLGTAVTAKENLLTFGIRDGSRPVTHANLLLPPGELIVGVFGTGQFATGFGPPKVDLTALGEGLSSTADVEAKDLLKPAYRLSIEAGELLSLGKAAPHGSKDTAMVLRKDTRFGEVHTGESWYRIEVSAGEVVSRYTVEAGIELSQTLTAELTDAAGKVLTNATSNRFGQLTLQNLALETGTYYLKTVDTPSAQGDSIPTVRHVQWRTVGVVADGEEREPNAPWLQANQVDFAKPLSGQMEEVGDQDLFQFQVEQEQASGTWNLVLESAELKRVQLCLLTHVGVQRQCRNGEPPLALEGLNLNSGVHGALVERSTEPGAYSLSLKPTKPMPRGQEQEPNDKPEDVSLFGERRIIKGTLSKQDTDQFLLLTTDAPQLWRLQAIGSGLHDLRYWPQHGDAGQSVRAGTGSRRLRLDNLFLLPGQHRFSLTAREDTSYVLRALPLGPPSPYIEREPNNERNTAHSLPLNQKAVALLTETTDADTFRWYLAAAQPVRLSLRAAPDAGYHLTLYQDGGQIKQFVLTTGESLEETFWLDPGDYYLRVSSSPTSEAEYELQVDQLAAPVRVSDREPNDNVNTAANWPTSWHFQGRLGVSRAAADWYQLPARKSPLTLLLPKLAGAQMQFVDRNRKRIAEPETDAEGVSRIILPPGEGSYLFLSGSGDYDFRIQPDDGVVGPESGVLPLEMNLASGAKPLAAYSDWQQNLTGSVTLRNTSEQSIEAQLVSWTTDDRWKLRLADKSVEVAAGATVKIPIQLTVEPDAWPDPPVILRVSARDDDNRFAQAEHSITAIRQAVPVNPSVYSPVPEQLRGHINVAATARGAQWLRDPKKFANLNDGRLALGWFFQSKRASWTGPAMDVPTIDLAGEEAVQVTGFSLHPFGLQDGQPAQRNARDFSVALSEDGETFETVLTAALDGHMREQFFTLTKPYRARYARLQLRSSKDAYIIALGEWKVLADPASVLDSVGRNLADPLLGGHVVSMASPLPNYGKLEPMLVTGDNVAANRLRKGFDAAWVLGFHHNRAARIGRITWRNSEKGTFFESVKILASPYSPLGPWTTLGDWTLDGSGEQIFDLPQPAWARFVKFDVADKAAGTNMALPDQIKIIEAPDAHGSILGEWGYDSLRGPYEVAHPPVLAADAKVSPKHSERAQAHVLQPNKPFDGVVRLAAYDNWYRVTVPEGHNTMALELTGSPTVRAEVTVLDATDTPVDLEVVDSFPNEVLVKVAVVPGDYLVKISEPPRSVIFTWDTSGSTGAVRPIIRQAVLNYVQDVKPELDEAKMLPFGGDFLSRQWLDQPYLLQSVLNDYNGAGNSSEAESALVKASRALKNRRGQRVIVLITDAATGSDNALWTELADVHPRIIALGVSSVGAFGSKPLRERDLMQDWAAASGGYYEYVENVGSMERAFDRASSKIRQPAQYQIAMTTRFEPEPEPGFLEVVTAPPGTEPDIMLPARTVEIVLDASGSMLQHMEGKRRYQIARETLTELVEEQLPDSVQFALRVFGHEEAGSCRTDLVMPVAKLNRAVVKKKLAEIVPKNLAKTPIGASLAAVAQDLAGVAGEKVVLLITDGEETCEGDVEAAIEKLSGAGIDAVVNIVGFAVDDAELEATFKRWSSVGGGVYRNATDQRLLGTSIAALTAQPFTIFNASSEVVGSGVAGAAPIALPPGNFVVRFSNQYELKAQISSGVTSQVAIHR